MIDLTYIVKKRVYRNGICVSCKRLCCTSSYKSATNKLQEYAFNSRKAGEMYMYVADNVIVTIRDNTLTYYSITYESICIPY